jgi:hypothetical protein
MARLAPSSKLQDSYADALPASRALYERARRIFPDAVTHDNRRMQPFPLYIARADGAYKWDVDGNRYVDYWMGHGALLLGHNPRQVAEAVREQALRGTHYGACHEKEVEWWVHLLELGENLSLRNRQSRDDLIRYLKGEIDPWRVFGRVREIDEHPPPFEPEPPKPGEEGEPPRPLFAAAPVPSGTPSLDPPVSPSVPEVLHATHALTQQRHALLSISAERAEPWPAVMRSTTGSRVSALASRSAWRTA